VAAVLLAVGAELKPPQLKLVLIHTVPQMLVPLPLNLVR
jgi:hypothetical protein